MLKQIIRRITWFWFLFVTLSGLFMIAGGVDGYLTHSFYETEKTVPLSGLETRFSDGDYVKAGNFRVDFKHRVRGLYDKSEARDLTLLIPLRPPEERPGDPINYLLVLPDQGTIVDEMYDEYNETGIDMQRMEEMVFEVSEIDELPGDVPEAVRKNKRVSKNVTILWYKQDDPAYGVFLLFGSLFLGYMGIRMLREYYRIKRSASK